MKNYIIKSLEEDSIQSIDVIIPTYNHAQYVKDAVLSVMTQVGVNTNIIVVDDGSTDNTKSIIGKLMRSYSNIRYIKQQNQGLSSARNTGLSQIKSKYVAFLDADDTWESDKLRKQIEVFKKRNNKSLGLVYCDFNNISVNGEKQSHSTFILKREIRGSVYSNLLEGNYVAGSSSSVLVKAESFKKCGQFDGDLESCEDWDMWLRISREYSLDYVDQKLVNIRLSPKSMSSNQQKMCLGMVKLYEKHRDLLINTQSMKNLYTTIFPVIVGEFPHTHTINLIKSKITQSAFNSIFRLTFDGIRVLFTCSLNRLIAICIKAFK